MENIITFTLGFASSLLLILIFAKVKIHKFNKQQETFKNQFGEVIEFTYQNKDGKKTTFIADGNDFKDKKE